MFDRIVSGPIVVSCGRLIGLCGVCWRVKPRVDQRHQKHPPDQTHSVDQRPSLECRPVGWRWPSHSAGPTISAAAKPRTLKLAKPGFRLGRFLSHPLLPFPGQAHSIDQLVERRVSTHISNDMFIRSCAGHTFRSSGQQPYKIVQARLLAPFTRMSSRRPRITASGLLLLQIFPFLALLLRLRQKHLRLRKSLRPSNRSRAFPARRRDVRRRLLRGSKGLHAAARTHVLLRQLMLMQLMRT